MAISNAVGSNIFDILVCMGLPWLLRTMVIGGPVEIYSQGELCTTFIPVQGSDNDHDFFLIKV